MSYDEHDAAYDEWMDKLYREHKKEAISEFTTERLQSYFLDSPEVAKPSTSALSEARALMEAGFNSAAFLFAQIATETGMKFVLLKPIVSGLVHDTPTAALVSDLALGHIGLDRFRGLLFEVLRRIGGIDLSTFTRPGCSQKLWEEVGELQKIRNSIVHRADLTSGKQTARAIAVAEAVMGTLFPALVKALGLHLHDGWRVCGDSLCQLEEFLGVDVLQRLRSRNT